MSIRTERLAQLIKQEVAQLLTTDFSEQIKPLVTVTDARITNDLSIAYVYFSIYGDEAEKREAAFQHLETLKPEIRSALASRIRHQVRKVPELRFFLDESIQRAQRMDDLFKKIRAERERREDDAS